MARYDTIGIDYDSTRKADSYLAQKMYDFILADETTTAAKYLDVGCGTGNYTAALSSKGLDFTGIDPSEEMLSKARLKNDTVTWKQGSAEELPIESASVDGVLVSLSIHHWGDLNKGFREIHRVLKDGAKFVLFSTLPNQTRAYWLAHYFPKMIENSAVTEPPLENIEAAFEQAPLEIIASEPYYIKADVEDRFLYCGKHNPEIYFREEIRQSISSFSLRSDPVEVEQGLKRLREDVDSGRIAEVIKAHENGKGDYQFFVAQKNP